MNSNTVKKLTLVLLVSTMVHLMFSISGTQQTGLNQDQNVESLNEMKDLDAQRLNHKLALSNQMIHYLIKKYSDNAKLRDYLKMYKKKKQDENFQDEDDDYNYPTRFRF